ncbi:MAG: hypothetical protein ABI353_05615 [Isosphaeraceae bacterium]
MIARFCQVAVPAVLLGLVVGCGQGRPGAGLTNGPPPGDGENAAMRTDLPTSALPAPGFDVGQLGDNDTDAGTGGRGGGETDQPKLSQGDESVRADPAAIETGGAKLIEGESSYPTPKTQGNP